MVQCLSMIRHLNFFLDDIAGLAVNYGISNTTVLEIQ